MPSVFQRSRDVTDNFGVHVHFNAGEFGGSYTTAKPLLQYVGATLIRHGSPTSTS